MPHNQITSYVDGDYIWYRVKVTNPNSNALPISGIILSDDLQQRTGVFEVIYDPAGLFNGNVTLAGGESQITTYRYQISQAELNSGSLVSTVNVTSNEFGTILNETVTIIFSGELTIVKQVNNLPEPGSVVFPVGHEIEYSITVTNIGSGPATNVQVFDEMNTTGNAINVVDPLNLFTGGITLESGDSGNITYNYSITQTDIDSGNILNEAYVTSNELDPVYVDPNPFVFGEGYLGIPGDLVIRKFEHADSLAERPHTIGDTISYVIEVENVGDSWVDNVQISDTLYSDSNVTNRAGDTELFNGGIRIYGRTTKTITYDYTIDQADVDSDLIANIACIEQPGYQQKCVDLNITDDDLKRLGLLQISKIETTVDNRPYSLNEPIGFTVIVKNVGEFDVTNIIVTDNKKVNNLINNLTLAPGQESSVPYQYIVSQSDINNAANQIDFVNTVTAYGISDNKTLTPVTDSIIIAPEFIGARGEIILSKAIIGNVNLPNIGDEIKYRVVVTNIGNRPANNVILNDSLGRNNIFPIGPLELGSATTNPDLFDLPTTIPGGSSETIDYKYYVNTQNFFDGYINNTIEANYNADNNPYISTADENIELRDPAEIIIETTGENQTVYLPFINTNLGIDWGDGNISTSVTQDFPSHTYNATEGTQFTVKVRGTTTAWTGGIDNNTGLVLSTLPNALIGSKWSWLKRINAWGQLEATKANFINVHGLTYISDDIEETITNLSRAFQDWGNNNPAVVPDISNWDTSNVTNMSYMFHRSTFNRDISTWDTSTVTNMSYMFAGTESNNVVTSFNNNSISLRREYRNANKEIVAQGSHAYISWDTSAVTNMSYMFYNATSFDHDISNWEVGNVEDMSYMFAASQNYLDQIGPTHTFNQPLASWDVSAVKNMSGMFKSNNNFDQPLASWSLSQLEDTSYMFHAATSFNQNIRAWDVSRVEDMSYMFQYAIDFNQDIASLNPASAGDPWTLKCVNDISYMFDGAIAFNNGDVDNELTYPIKFRWVTVSGDAGHLIDAATDLDLTGIFKDAINFNQQVFDNTDILATEKFTNVSYMFNGASSYNNGNNPIVWESTNRITDATSMFEDASNFNQNVTFNTSNILSMANMFMDCISFTAGGEPTGLQPISSYWNTGKVTNMSNMFSGAILFNQDISGWNVSSVEDMSYMFYNANAFNRDISGWGFGADLQTMNNMFGAALNNQSYSYSSDNYNALLISINDLVESRAPSPYPTGVNFLNTKPEYTSEDAHNAKTNLVQQHLWQIDNSPNVWTISSVNNFIATPITNNHIKLTWEDTNFNETGYVIERSTDPINDFVQVHITEQNVTTWDNYNLDPNTTYYYKIYAQIVPPGTTSDKVATDATTYGNPAELEVVLSNANQTIYLPFIGAQGYVDWGNGVYESIENSYYDNQNYNYPKHTYSGANVGTPITIKFAGTINEWSGGIELAATGVSTFAGWSWLRKIIKWGDTKATKANLINLHSLITIDNQLDISITNISGMFQNWGNSSLSLEEQALGYISNTANIPNSVSIFNTSNILDMSYMFAGTPTFNRDISTQYRSQAGDIVAQGSHAYISWDTSKVTNMSHMFAGALAFNRDISNWSTSDVANMSHMFNNANIFNINLTAWNVSAVTDMSGMFKYAALFNNDETKLDWATNTALVENMSEMFKGQPDIGMVFNQDISDWDVSKVTTMKEMFRDSTSFNNGGVALDWANTGLVADMSAMFGKTSNLEGPSAIFNQDISSWDVSKVQDMSAMFQYANAFNNGGVALDWANTGLVADMSAMFNGASLFNQNISTWNVGNVTNMNSMFKHASLFNKNIGSWTTNLVTDMGAMFEHASLFNQDISNWNISSIIDNNLGETEMSEMLLGSSAFSSDNYEALLISIDQQVTAASGSPIGISFDLADPDYTTIEAKAARDNLVNNYQWIIDESPGFDIYAPTNFVGVAVSDDAIDLTWEDNLSTDASAYIIHRSLTFDFTSYEEFRVDKNAGNEYTDTDLEPGTGYYYRIYATNNLPAFNPRILSDATLVNAAPHRIQTFGEPAIFEINITLEQAGQPIYLPIVGTYSSVNWDFIPGQTDSNFIDLAADDHYLETGDNGNDTWIYPKHTYTTPGTYEVRIIGKGPQNVNNTIKWKASGEYLPAGDSLWPWLRKIISWGQLNASSATLENARSLTEIASDLDPGIIDISNMFNNWGAINIPDITTLDVQSVQTMDSMFEHTTSFNQDISNWSVGDLKSVKLMFNGATAFNQNLNNWQAHLSNRTAGNDFNPTQMFENASAFNNGQTGATVNPMWATFTFGNGLIMDNMFNGATAFNQNISTWDVSGIISMEGVFKNTTSFNQNISTQYRDNAGNITSEGLHEYISWHTANVQNMSNMFDGSSFNQNISSWDTSSVTNMSGMFRNTTAFNQDISNWTFSNIAQMPEPGMHQMFQNATGFSNSFYEDLLFNILLDVEANPPTAPTGVNLSEAYPAYELLEAAEARNILVTDYQWSIDDDGAGSTDTIFEINITSEEVGEPIYLPLRGLSNDINATIDWGTGSGAESLTYSTTGFYKTSGGYHFPKYTYNEIGTYRVKCDVTYNANISTGAYLSGIDDNADIVTYNSTDAATLKYFPWLTRIDNWGDIYASGAGGDNLINLRGIYSLQYITPIFPISLTSLKCMFERYGTDGVSGATDLNIFNINLFRTGSILNMSRMFAYTSFGNVKEISGSSWDVSAVTNMKSMFEGTQQFNQDITGWDISSVRNMSRMFYDATSFDQDISQWVFASIDRTTDNADGNISMKDMLAKDPSSGSYAFSSDNYNKLLVSIVIYVAANNGPQGSDANTRIIFTGTHPVYTTTSAHFSRNELVDDWFWDIEDDDTGDLGTFEISYSYAVPRDEMPINMNREYNKDVEDSTWPVPTDGRPGYDPNGSPQFTALTYTFDKMGNLEQGVSTPAGTKLILYTVLNYHDTIANAGRSQLAAALPDIKFERGAGSGSFVYPEYVNWYLPNSDALSIYQTAAVGMIIIRIDDISSGTLYFETNSISSTDINSGLNKLAHRSLSFAPYLAYPFFAGSKRLVYRVDEGAMSHYELPRFAELPSTLGNPTTPDHIGGIIDSSNLSPILRGDERDLSPEWSICPPQQSFVGYSQNNEQRVYTTAPSSGWQGGVSTDGLFEPLVGYGEQFISSKYYQNMPQAWLQAGGRPPGMSGGPLMNGSRGAYQDSAGSSLPSNWNTTHASFDWERYSNMGHYVAGTTNTGRSFLEGSGFANGPHTVAVPCMKLSPEGGFCLFHASYDLGMRSNAIRSTGDIVPGNGARYNLEESDIVVWTNKGWYKSLSTIDAGSNGYAASTPWNNTYAYAADGTTFRTIGADNLTPYDTDTGLPIEPNPSELVDPEYWPWEEKVESADAAYEYTTADNYKYGGSSFMGLSYPWNGKKFSSTELANESNRFEITCTDKTTGGSGNAGKRDFIFSAVCFKYYPDTDAQPFV